MRDLRATALRGMFWSGIQQIGERGLRLPIYLILARLLSPEAFGLFALSAAYVDFLQLFRNQGLSAAIVQRERLEPEHLDSAFWGGLLLAMVMGGAGYASAGVFAQLAGQPDLAPIVRWLSLAFFVSGLSTVQDAILRREVRFQALAVRSLVSQSVAGAVAIGVALRGGGVWSLVALLLVSQGVGVLLLWRASTWRPRWRFSWLRFRELWAFGIHMLGVHILRFARNRADNLLIGVGLGAIPLGYYTVVRNLVDGLTALVMGTVSPVLWSILSRLQRELDRLARAVYQAAEMVGLVTWPIFFGVAAVAPELVPVFLGDRWAASVPIVPALAAAAIVKTVTSLHLTAITAIGEAGWRMRIEALIAVVTLTAMVIALPWGVVAVAWAFAIAILLMTPLQLRLGFKLLALETGPYLGAYRIPLIGSLVMLGVVVASRMALDGLLAEPPRLAALVLLGTATYAVCVWLAAPDITRRAWENLRIALHRSPRGA